MIHPLAWLDDSAEIGEGATIWQFASVIRGASIGRETTIGSCGIVDGAIVGEHCAIGHCAQLHPGTKIGDGVFIGPGAIICNDMWPSVDKDGFELPANGKYTVVVEDGASIGAGAIILPGVRIGKGAVVAAGAVVERSVIPGAVHRRNGYISPEKPQDWRERRMQWVV